MLEICMFLKPQFSGRNGEDDVSLIRKRRSISGEHSLRSVVNAVRYVVRMNSRACLCY